MSRTLSRPQALLLGLIVLLGAGLALLGLFAVGSRGWFATHVRVGFRNIHGVEVGTRVHINGLPVGEVVAIQEPQTRDGMILLRLAIENKYRHMLSPSSKVRILSVGMLGGHVLDIETPPLKPGEEDKPIEEDALLASETSLEVADEAKQTLQSAEKALDVAQEAMRNIQNGQGKLGEELVATLRQIRNTSASVGQGADALKQMPIVRDYVEDPTSLLVRPNCERNRQVFTEAELFEPGRAVLTAQGRQRLDNLAPWLEGMKHKGSEVVVASYADPRRAKPSLARTLTRQQSEAVCDYLKKQHSIQKMGWFSSRKVTPLGQGVNPPPAQERDPLPPARVEVLVFVPQG